MFYSSWVNTSPIKYINGFDVRIFKNKESNICLDFEIYSLKDNWLIQKYLNLGIQMWLIVFKIYNSSTIHNVFSFKNVEKYKWEKSCTSFVLLCKHIGWHPMIYWRNIWAMSLNSHCYLFKHLRWDGWGLS